MSRYAESTAVSSERSRGEIERTLTRYGAVQFMYGWKDQAALIAFRAKDRNIRFLLPMPDRESDEFWRTPARRSMRSPEERDRAYDQAVRQRWRALALAIKAKLEAVEAGITQFEEEFYAHIVLPGGRTIYEETSQNVAVAYESGKMPPLLPYFGS